MGIKEGGTTFQAKNQFSKSREYLGYAIKRHASTTVEASGPEDSSTIRGRIEWTEVAVLPTLTFRINHSPDVCCLADVLRFIVPMQLCNFRASS